MTTTPAVTTVPLATSIGPAWTASVRRAWAEYRAYRATFAELRALTDAQLRDVGMRRDALRSIARETARKI